MKKIVLLMLAVCLMCSAFSVPVSASDAFPKAENFGTFVVGTTSKLTGAFFTSMWGDNTSDIDVRHLIHGYSPVYWWIQPTFAPDPTVVLSLQESEKDDGGKLYVVQIHDNLKFCDGSPITAYDYAFSYMLGAAPEIDAIGGAANITTFISGYDDYHSGGSGIFSGVRVFDSLTFGLEIDAKYLPFFYELGYLDAAPYPISVIAPGCEVADDGNGAYIRNINQTVKTPIFTAELLRRTILDPETGYLSHPSVTSGPYMLSSYDAASGVARFNINPYYLGNWNGVIPTIDDVVMKPVIPATMMKELEEGTVQLLNKVVAAENINEGMVLVGEGWARTENYPRLGMGFLHFSCDNGVFMSQSVRQAVAYLLDRPAFTYAYTDGYAITSHGYYGMGQWMYLGSQGILNEYITASPEEEEAWNELAADFRTLNQYGYSPERAKQLLMDDGWILNENGGVYVDGVDTFRYKMVDGTLTLLSVRWGKLKDSYAAEILHRLIEQPFAEAGIMLKVDTLSYTDLMDYFYRTHDYTYDMMYLATNFMSVFDPSHVFSTKEECVGITNMSGYRDGELEAKALDMRKTEPGDLLSYERKWVAFQKAFNEKLPQLPLYSNIYFDFYTPLLTGYFPNIEMSFPVALLSASYGSVKPGAAAMDEDTIFIPD